jgi:putative spermidine/putrescine transport system substrate-binding protein
MRKVVLIGLVLAVSACGAPDAPTSEGGPVTLNVLDVAGNLQLTQGMIDEFVEQHPDVIKKVTTSKAPAPELAGKLKAQQDAGRLDIDIVLTGNDGLAGGIDQGLWTKLLPANQKQLARMNNYLEPAAKMQELAQGYGVVVTYYPSGPLIEYNPAKVTDPPTSAQELLAWAKAHPKRVMYARPANSGPGRTLLMGLPYILGDKDPKDPEKGWDKTWAYLAELDKYIDYYPSGTADTMKNLGNGTVDIIATTTGWDINPRVLGTVPKEVKTSTYEGFHWVTDAHYLAVPKGISKPKLNAILKLLDWMLTPEQQAKAYDDGYFYPGPAIEGVTIGMAPDKSRQAITEYGRPEYDKLIEDNPKETPLPADQMVKAFDLWDRKIGGSKVRQS